MGKSVLEELVTVLGFEIDDKDLKKFNRDLEAVHNGMKKVAAIGAAAAAGVGVFVNAIAVATDETFKFAQTVGASFGEVQRLTHATEIWGGTAGDVMSTLTQLARISSSAARGQGGGEIFGILGLSPTDASGRVKNSIDLLGEVADRIRTMGSAAEQADFVQKLGISERMILLLRKGSAGIEELGRELDRFGFILTPEQGKIAEDYVDALVRGKAAVKGLGNQIGLRLAPTVTAFVDDMIKWVEANKGLIDSNFDGWIDKLGKAMGPLKVAVTGLAAALAGGAIMRFLTLLAQKPAKGSLIGALVALSLALDDIFEFAKGNPDTASGRALEPLLKGDPDLGRGRRFRINSGIEELIEQLKKAISFGSEQGAGLGLGGNEQTTNSSNHTSINPVFNIRSTDPAGVGREVDERMRQLAGSFLNVRSPFLA